MKQLFTLIAIALMAVGCGVGSYSHSSGKSDICEISFTSPKKMSIDVEIDGKQYALKSVKTSDFKRDRNIKKTAENTLRLEPGKHEVKVTSDGKELFSKQIMISTSEHKVIDLL